MIHLRLQLNLVAKLFELIKKPTLIIFFIGKILLSIENSLGKSFIYIVYAFKYTVSALNLGNSEKYFLLSIMLDVQIFLEYIFIA